MNRGIFLLWAILLNGLIAFANTELPNPADSRKTIDAVLADFNYEGFYSEATQQRTSRLTDPCQTFEVQFQTNYPDNPGEPLSITGTFYIPRWDKALVKVPIVVQLPPTGGVNFLDEWMALAFCSRRIAALVIKNDFTGLEQEVSQLPPIEDHDHAFHRTGAAIKGALAWARDHHRVNGEKAGIFGVSLGGILGSFIYGIEDRLSAGFFLVAGSDIPYILAHSDETRVTKVRQLRMAEQGLKSTEEYLHYLRQNLTYDNGVTAQRIPPESLNYVISHNDTTVPSVNQYQLRDESGSPDAHYSSSDHVWTVVNTLIWRANREAIANFYRERFALESPRGTSRKAQLAL